MSTYKEIHGKKIRNYTTNPDNPITGEVWYNTTDNVLKFQYPNTTTSGSWATSLNNTQRRLAGAGSYTAALAITGTADPPLYANTELFNGAVGQVNDVNTAREERLQEELAQVHYFWRKCAIKIKCYRILEWNKLD